MMTIYLVLFSLSFTISLIITFIIKQRFSQQLLDIPNERSSHTQPTPRGGGLGFIIAFAITSSVYIITNSSLEEFIFLWLVLVSLSIIGIIDDNQDVPAAIRYLVQLLAASIAIFHFHPFIFPGLDNLGIFGNIIAIALTVIGFTAMINFYNFMDGLDGIVGGCSAVQLGFLAIYFNQPLLWLLVAAIMGFLWWNWSPAKIFMGDAGSTVLGATVAIALLNNHTDMIHAWSAVAIIFPLIADAIYTLVRRILKGENIFQAHRSHIYQRLQQSGWSHSQVASTYICLNIVIGVSVYYFDFIGFLISLGISTLLIVLGEIYLATYQKSTES
ncbi:MULTISPECIES: MraY family glycosyltransferase [Crocosphaera]|uniref:MraY family glycosyltransferase n=1 Tax=Crocosphaera TaxID=263510 RepID=UPI00258F6A56|nr:glycosyltransferase family 4 protein [Crocosphaera sp.]MCH2244468.1 glycosyltransferase family 4 protein [Crocosphaera sp.]